MRLRRMYSIFSNQPHKALNAFYLINSPALTRSGGAGLEMKYAV